MDDRRRVPMTRWVAAALSRWITHGGLATLPAPSTVHTVRSATVPASPAQVARAGAPTFAAAVVLVRY